MKTPLTPRQRLNVVLVILAALVYLGLTFVAPHPANPNPYHLSIVVILLLTVSIVGLWMAVCFFGLFAWVKLDTYSMALPKGANRTAYGQIAGGVRVLAYGLLLSSIFSASAPYFAGNAAAAAAVMQVNNLIVLIAPFLGFLYLRFGTRSLAVSAHAAMSVRAKLVTVGPPVVLLAVFYVVLAATNQSPNALPAGPLGFLMLPFNIVMVVGSWIFGLLAALNIERATHRGAEPSQTGPMVRLYNAILTMTGGFIILDALLSLGTNRLASLPFGITVLLLYAFIGVVALGFALVWASARAYLAAVKTGG